MAHRQGAERLLQPPAPTTSSPKVCTKCGDVVHRIPVSRRGPVGYCQRCRDQDYLERSQIPVQPAADHSVPAGPACGFCLSPMESA
ncbi:hypothetical protein ACFVDT_17960 [Streptomyces sp. NPDC057699]|uniref:hypothetical protein n=1 Tax=Streptomyces sp. NPDC057699 TaxID=3346220 RepID=UPI0036773297